MKVELTEEQNREFWYGSVWQEYFDHYRTERILLGEWLYERYRVTYDGGIDGATVSGTSEDITWLLLNL